jgi:hypothetical protein
MSDEELVIDCSAPPQPPEPDEDAPPPGPPVDAPR